VFCGVINTLAHWRSNVGINRDVTDTGMRAEQLRDQREHAAQGGHPTRRCDVMNMVMRDAGRRFEWWRAR
jgi:hypothetical protein